MKQTQTKTHGTFWEIHPQEDFPIPWGWKNDPTGKWVLEPRGEVVMPHLEDYFDWSHWSGKQKVAFSGTGNWITMGTTWMKSVFTTATRFLGTEEALIRLSAGDLAPDLEKITAEFVRWNNRLIKESVNIVALTRFVIGDDIGTTNGLLFSPRVYARHLLPFHREVAAVGRSAGLEVWFHSDGDVSELLPTLGEVFDGIYHEPVGGMENPPSPRPIFEFIPVEQWNGGWDV